MRPLSSLSVPLLVIPTLCIAALVCEPAYAQETGSAVSVKQQASLESDSDSVKIIRGTEIATGDTIATNASGQVRVDFTDGTRLLVGPNSKMVVEEYLLSSNSSVSKFSMNALSGTYRFITGRSNSQAYSIRTPSATIGVRGTTIDFKVVNPTYMVAWNGTGILCNLGGICVELDEPCSVGVVNGAAPQEVTSESERSRILVEEFGGQVLGQRRVGVSRLFQVSLDQCPEAVRTRNIEVENFRRPVERHIEGNDDPEPEPEPERKSPDFDIVID